MFGTLYILPSICRGVKIVVHDHVNTEITCKGIKNVVEALLAKGLTLTEEGVQSDTLMDVMLLIGIDFYFFRSSFWTEKILVISNCCFIGHIAKVVLPE